MRFLCLVQAHLLFASLTALAILLFFDSEKRRTINLSPPIAKWFRSLSFATYVVDNHDNHEDQDVSQPQLPTRSSSSSCHVTCAMRQTLFFALLQPFILSLVLICVTRIVM